MEKITTTTDCVVTNYGTVPARDIPPELMADMVNAPKRSDGWWDMRYRVSRRAVSAFEKVEREIAREWDSGNG